MCALHRGKPVIAVAPIGSGLHASMEALAPTLAETFDAEIVVAPELPLPRASWNPARRQVRATMLLDLLASAKQPDWERLLGIADVDLYAPDLNFVFGEADPRTGVAVVSLARLRQGATGELLRRRVATEAIHELGHTYGLSHCSDPSCVMWFSNTLAESDRKGARLCAMHAAGFGAARRTGFAHPRIGAATQEK